MDVFIHGVCPVNCPCTCSLKLEVVNGTLIDIKGNPDHPLTRGYVCPKVKYILKRAYSHQRITKALLKDGTNHRVISLSDAIQILAARIEKTIDENGSEKILEYSYSGHMGLISRNWASRLFSLLGTATVEYDICSRAGELALFATHGTSEGIDPEEIPEKKLIIIWGCDPARTNPQEFRLLVEAKRRGSKIWIIDPIETFTAHMGQHVPIKPGMDLLLALGIARLLIEMRLVSPVSQRNYDIFESILLKTDLYEPENVSRLSGVPVKVMREIAFDLSSVRPLVIHIGYGMQRQREGGKAVQAISFLPALVGEERGFIYDGPPVDMTYLRGAQFSRRTFSLTRFASYYSSFDLVIIHNANPVATMPRGAQILSLERKPWTVVIDYYPSDTTSIADLIIPISAFFEQVDYHVSYWHRYFMINRKATDPPSDIPSNLEWVHLLARELGIKHPLIFESPTEAIDKTLEYSGYSIRTKELETRDFLKFPPPRKILFVDFYPSIKGVMSFPHHEHVQNKYPIHLLTPVHALQIHSQFFEESRRDVVVEISSNDAMVRNIRDGDEVIVFNDNGMIKIPCRVSYKIPEGVARIFSSPSVRRVPLNILITDALQYGNSALADTWVEIRKV
ncbi:MAG: molybdopterin-dependent oxidoreductase [Candidatus Korarchaeota archaeon]